MNRIHICDCCGHHGTAASDQTDPSGDELVIDSRGLVSANEWVCGSCLSEAEERLARAESDFVARATGCEVRE